MTFAHSRRRTPAAGLILAALLSGCAGSDEPAAGPSRQGALSPSGPSTPAASTPAAPPTSTSSDISPAPAAASSIAAVGVGPVRVTERRVLRLAHGLAEHLSLSTGRVAYAAAAGTEDFPSQARLVDLATGRDSLVASSSYPHGEVSWVEVDEHAVVWHDLDRVPDDANHSVRWRIFLAPLTGALVGRPRLLAESSTPQEFPPLPRLRAGVATWTENDAQGSSRVVVARQSVHWRRQLLPGTFRSSWTDVVDSGHVVVDQGDGRGNDVITVVDIATGRRDPLTHDPTVQHPRGGSGHLAWELRDPGNLDDATVVYLSRPGETPVTLRTGSGGNVAVGAGWVAYLTTTGGFEVGAPARQAAALTADVAVAGRLSADGDQLAYLTADPVDAGKTYSVLHVVDVSL